MSERRLRVRPVAIVGAFIAYGSLYPFDFVAPDVAGSALHAFFENWRLWTSRGDVLGNVGLFVPFGLAGVWWTDGRIARTRAAASTVTTGIALALALQVAQIWLATRSPLLADVLWNTVGILIGVCGGLVFGTTRAAREVKTDAARTAGLALIGLWFLSELAPLVPSLDLAGMRRSLRPLLVTPQFDLVMTIYQSAKVLLVGWLAAAVVGPRRALACTGAAVIAVLGGKLVIIAQSLDWTIITGCGAGLALVFLIGQLRRESAVVAALVWVVGAYSLQSLAPFTVRAPEPLMWIPFASVLNGSMLTNVRALSSVGFVVGGAVWLMRDLGWHPLRAGLGLALWVLLLEIAQMWIVERTPSSTEPVIALIAGWALSHVHDKGRASITL